MAGGYVPGSEVVPGYRLLEFLGRGGFGEVWKATAPGGALTALKVIALHGKRGTKEYRALQLVKTIRHPNLVPVTASWLKDAQGRLLDENLSETIDLADLATSTPISETIEVDSIDQLQRVPAELIIAMGLGDKSLADRLNECLQQGLEGVPPDELLEYMHEAARAIDFLNSPRHELGEGPVAIQHRDIKPQNILIVGNAVQVCDFGLARTLSDVTVTQFAGSPAYSPPECLDGNRASPTTDQYSLAVTYIELRTGILPFDDDSLMGVINAHLQSKLNLSRLAPAERAVIARATSYEPEARFPSARDMVRALTEAVSGRAPTDSDAGGAVPAEKPKADKTAQSPTVTMTMPGLDEAVRPQDTTPESSDTRATTVGDPRSTKTTPGAPITVASDAAGRSTMGEAGRPPRTQANAIRRYGTWFVGGAAVLLAIVAGTIMYQRGGEEPTVVDGGTNGSASIPAPVSPEPRPTDAALINEVAQWLDRADQQLATSPQQVVMDVGKARARLAEALASDDPQALAERAALDERGLLLEARAFWRMGLWPELSATLEQLDKRDGSPSRDVQNYAFLRGLARFHTAGDAGDGAAVVKDAIAALNAAGRARLEAWEHDKLDEFARQFVPQVNERANALADEGSISAARELVAELLRYKDNDVGARLLMAEFSLVENRPVDARESLNRLPNQFGNASLAARHAVLHALVAVEVSDNDDETLAATLTNASQRVTQAEFVGSKSPLGRVLARLIRAAGGIDASSRGRVTAAIDHLASLQGAQLDAELVDQVSRVHVESLRKRLVLDLDADSPPDFTQMGRDCEMLWEARQPGSPPDGLVVAAWTEAAIESSAAKRPPRDVLLGELDIAPEFEPYREYVRLMQYAEDQKRRTAAALDEAVEQFTARLDPSQPPRAVRAGYRLLRAAEVLTDWAASLRQSTDAGAPLAAITSPYRSADDADRVNAALSPLAAMMKPADRPQALTDELALAAWHGAARDPADARRKTAALLQGHDEATGDRLPLWFAHAAAHAEAAARDPAARQMAASAYSKLVSAIVDDTALGDDGAVALSEALIAPALELDPGREDEGAVLAAELAAPLATLYGWSGRLLAQYPHAPWPDNDQGMYRREFEAFSRAVALDRTAEEPNAEHLVMRGRAALKLYSLPDAELREAGDETAMLDLAERDARAALSLDADDAEASTLLAWVKSYRAKLVPPGESQRIVELMEDAERLYQKAVDASEPGTSKARNLAGLSNVYVWWSNFSGSTVQEKEDRLRQAVATALRAAEENPDYEDAWRALGNAHEDLAWVVAWRLAPGEEPPPEALARARQMADEHFAEAVLAHREAVRLKHRNALAHFDLGRALFRSVVEHFHDPATRNDMASHKAARATLEEAVNSLRESIELNPADDQAHYFLARSLAQLGRYPEAAEHFAQAAELAIAAGRREPMTVGEWAAATIAALQAVQPASSRRSLVPGAKPVLAAARESAATLRSLPQTAAQKIADWGYHDPAKDGLAISAYADALEGRIDEALAALDATIPASPGRQDVALLIARAQCRLAQANAQRDAEAKRSLELAGADIETIEQRQLIDPEPLESLGTRTQWISALDSKARINYQLAKLAPGVKERGFALAYVRILIEDPFQHAHPLGWQWREMAADLLIDDLAKQGAAARILGIAAPRETARQYLEYARAAATDAQDLDRIAVLRSDLENMKPGSAR